MTERAYDKDTVWTNAVMAPVAPLAADHRAAVCVVGAGIAGLTTAYFLAKAGKDVIVLDDGGIGGGESGLTTAHLTNALDRRWASLARLHGRTRLRLAAESHTAAIATIEQIVREEQIDCDFRRVDGYLLASPGDMSSTLEDELRAARRARVPGVERVLRAPLADPHAGPAVRFRDQAQFHVLRYLSGLARAIERDGGRIYTRARVVEVDEEAEWDAVVVRTERDIQIVAQEVVLATNSPFLPQVTVHLKQAAYRTYAVALRVPRGTVSPALYWDTAEPFHYVRVSNLDGADGDDELLIVGGEDHRTGQAGEDADQRHGRLEAWARARFPQAGEVAHRWSGQVMETVDGLAYIGRIRKNSRVSIVTGDCGNGMTHGTIAAKILSDLFCGRENAWASAYDPGRVNLRPLAVSEYVRENLNTAVQYGAWLTPGELRDTAAIPPGCGAVVRRGLVKVAAYRDRQGQLHERSAVCTHMRGIVAWNPVERTWDCRCHGARFDCMGRVLRGPATADLQPLEPSEQPAEASLDDLTRRRLTTIGS